VLAGREDRLDSARHLRRVGWALVTATTATAGILIGLLR